MLYGVFLTYYDKYKERSLHEFNLLLNEIDENYKVIVVNNNAVVKNDKEGLHEVSGDNTNWEFTGWDKGFEQIGRIDPNDTFIICNDTFCQHNEWNDGIRNAFSKRFQFIYNKNNRNPFKAMSGTMDSFWQKFSIQNDQSFFWFSSYLFLMTGELKKNFPRLSLDEDVLNSMLTISKDGELEWHRGLSKNLENHLNGWMNPSDSSKGWYNKGVSNDIKLRKLKTILNEKYLSAHAISLGSVMYEVKSYKRFKFVLWNIFSRTKELLK